MDSIILQSAAIGGLVLIAGACSTIMGRQPNELDQRWKTEARSAWYQASQGSRLLPLAWANALELPTTEGRLFSDEHMSRLGYLPTTTLRGLRLPVGFAVDVTDPSNLGETDLRWKAGQGGEEPWVGMNCAACHTGQITYGDQRLTVDGAPGMGDYQTFMEDLRAALKATRDDPAKFGRFSAAVLAGDNSPDNRSRLLEALNRLIAREQELAKLNATPLRYGPGRVDAFGHIYNKVAYAVGAADQYPNPSDAPVSIPFLWNVPQHDRLQWNGAVSNIVAFRGREPLDVGALGRNVGEVIGVFADIQPDSSRLSGYRSSVKTDNLISFEQQLGHLRPPAWPRSVFPDAPDRDALVAEGRDLFQTRCKTCHENLRRDDLRSPIRAQFSYFNPATRLPEGATVRHPPPGTDPWMACNAYTKYARSGTLRGTPGDYFGLDEKKRAPMEDEADLGTMLEVTVKGVLVNRIRNIAFSGVRSLFGFNRPPEVTVPVDEGLSERERRLAECMTADSIFLGYKARPLTGIWATSPYLHNGSVRTLYQLLLPEAERETSFWTGSREFDPVDVGFRSEPGPDRFRFVAVDAEGSPIPGDSNRGHDYNNASLTERNRRALVEYLKTL